MTLIDLFTVLYDRKIKSHRNKIRKSLLIELSYIYIKKKNSKYGVR